MPSAQRMVEVANEFWRRDNLGNIDRAWFLPRDRGAAGPTSDYTQRLARGNEFDLGVAGGFPPGMSEMLRALYLYNLDGPRLGIQFVWMPAYDWELSVAECPGTPDSPGAFSVLIRGRYPRDPHPSTLR